MMIGSMPWLRLREPAVHVRRLVERGALAEPAVLLGCLTVIFVADAWMTSAHVTLAARGAPDEIAHLATTVVLLAALVRRPSAAFALGALIASVAIDLDHVPLYLRIAALTPGAGRPYSHSLFTVLVVLALATMSSGRWRAALLGAAFGLAGHLARDLATGTLPLLWPLTRYSYRWPYELYAGLLLVCVAMAVSRRPARSRFL